MRTLVMALLIAAYGCGDDAPANPPDAPTPDARMPDARMVDAPIVGNAEALVFALETRGLGNPTSNATASFFVGPVFGGPGAVADGCYAYPNTQEGGESAGNITLAGATSPITIVPMGTSPMVTYDATTADPADLFAPQVTLTFTAAGATVPAFSGSVMTPVPIAGETLPTALSRAMPSTVTWTSGTSTEVWVWLVTTAGSNMEHLVWCRTTDSGSFTITPAIMALVPAAKTNAIVVLFRTSQSELMAGAWDVKIVAADMVAALASVGP